jgi:hypothetical protein
MVSGHLGLNTADHSEFKSASWALRGWLSKKCCPSTLKFLVSVPGVGGVIKTNTARPCSQYCTLIEIKPYKYLKKKIMPVLFVFCLPFMKIQI